MEDAELENIPYFQKQKEDQERLRKNYKYAVKRVNEKSLNAEEIYGKIGESLEKSPIKVKDTTKPKRPVRDVFPRPAISPPETYSPVLETIPVDENRSIEIRTRPTSSQGNFEIAAVEKKTEFPPRSPWTSPDEPPPVPRVTKYDLGSLDLDESGHVNFVKGSYQGAKEGVTDRLMMEAAKRDMVPYSSTLLDPGSNMVGRFKKEYQSLPKEDYLEKVRTFLKTGKTGKIWSAATPYLGPIGMGLTALGALSYSDPSSAAVDMVIPGGLQEIGQNDREVMSDRKYRSANLIPNAGMLGNYTDSPDIGRYHESIRKLQGRGM